METRRSGSSGIPALTVDMVLTDVVMPGMTGAAFAAQAHALRPGIPILFMSGYEQEDFAGAGGTDPLMQIISKPYSRLALLAKVSQMLTAGAGAAEQAQPIWGSRQPQ